MIAAAGVKTVLLTVLVGTLAACDQDSGQTQTLDVEEQSPSPAGTETGLSDLIDQYRQQIMNIPGVVGMGIGKCAQSPDKMCVLVYAKTDEWPSELPRRLDGYEVELKKTGGDFRPLR